MVNLGLRGELGAEVQPPNQAIFPNDDASLKHTLDMVDLDQTMVGFVRERGLFAISAIVTPIPDGTPTNGCG
jgi:hypothetical protein